MIRLTDLAGNGSFTMGGKKFEYGKVYSDPFASAFSPVNEGKWENIMKGVRSGSQSGPWTIVVLDKFSKKVLHQEPIKIKDSIPAHYEAIKKKYPNKFISIEDNHGKQVYKEIAEGEDDGAQQHQKDGGDHEVHMAHNQLDSIIKSAVELRKKLGDNEKDIPAWIQDHISNAENYISQASSGYYEYSSNENVNEVITFKTPAEALKSKGFDINKAKAREGGKVGIITYHFGNGKKIKLKRKTTTSPFEIVNEEVNEDSPCWKGYKQVGMKMKNGKEVPNCVPEGVVKEAVGVPKMYVKYGAVQKKVRELEDKQKAMAAKYFAEKNPKTKERMMVDLKKGTQQLASYRRNLADIEDKYINNLYKDSELDPNFNI